MDFRILLIFAVFAAGIECSRILVLYPTISKSHIMPLQSLSLALAEKGHEITFFSTYPLGKKVKNYRDVEIPFNEADKTFIESVTKDPKSRSLTKVIPQVRRLLLSLSNDTLQMPEMKRIMKEEKFDLVIVGYFFTTEVMLGVADHFKCPSVLFSPAGAFSILNQAIGNPLAVSGTPNKLMGSKDNTFLSRVKTFIAYGAELLVFQYLKYYVREVYDFNFPQDRYRSLEESMKNVSMVLINSHFSSGSSTPQLPNMIEIGGVQVKPKPAPLPTDLKTFIDDAKDGAVLFSLGSNAKSTFLSKEVIATLLKVFSQLKQRVVMKWESDTLPGQPKNVFISKWLPQDDVLAHPNIKAFISHCGLGGVVESKFHGVPIVGFPLFAEQASNAASVEKEGWGIKLDMATITEESLKHALDEVLYNPKYLDTVKQASILAKDRPMNSQETGVFWIEYVLRHHGAPHMHYPGADLNFWQYNSIDVILFLAAIVYVVFKTLKLVCVKLCCRSNAKAVQPKKQKRN